MNKKTALITGATSGIGLATARVFAKNNLNLVLCGRNKERMENLQRELKPLTDIHCLYFDVSDRQSVFREISQLPEKFSKIDILINNAGNAHGLESFQDGDIDDWDAMIDGNVKGLLYVSRAILPAMLKQNSGHIIHIGSTAGKEVYPKGNVYCASKHAVDAINHGMRIDLNGTGIKVGAIHPGMVKTDFSKVRFKGDASRADKVYEGFSPLLPEDIAEVIWFMVTRPSHVNIADLMVLSTDQATSTIVNKK